MSECRYQKLLKTDALNWANRLNEFTECLLSRFTSYGLKGVVHDPVTFSYKWDLRTSVTPITTLKQGIRPRWKILSVRIAGWCNSSRGSLWPRLFILHHFRPHGSTLFLGQNKARIFKFRNLQMVANLRLGNMKNWSICDIFLKKQPDDEQEVKQSKQLSGATGNTFVFQICPTRCLNVWMAYIVLPWVLKFTQGQYFATQGKLKVVYWFCSTRNLGRSSTLWFMVNHGIYRKFVLW